MTQRSSATTVLGTNAHDCAPVSTTVHQLVRNRTRLRTTGHCKFVLSLFLRSELVSLNKCSCLEQGAHTAMICIFFFLSLTL